MFSIKKLIVACSLSTLFCGLPTDAKTATQTANKPNKPKTAYAVSTTTGWRKIDGWQKSVVDRDPNLGHWSWLGMREMEKSYVRLRPGQRDNSRPSRYVKPVALRTGKPHVAHYMSGDSRRAPGGGVYTRPVSVPLPSPMQVAATNAKLRAPATNISLQAPKTKLTFAAPSTSIKLAAPSTTAQLAVPRTNAQLAVPRTHIQLASKNTNIRLKAPVGDSMADCGGAPGIDTFEAPELESSLPYGPRRSSGASFSRAAAQVRGQLVKKHR